MHGCAKHRAVVTTHCRCATTAVRHNARGGCMWVLAPFEPVCAITGWPDGLRSNSKKANTHTMQRQAVLRMQVHGSLNRSRIASELATRPLDTPLFSARLIGDACWKCGSGLEQAKSLRDGLGELQPAMPAQSLVSTTKHGGFDWCYEHRSIAKQHISTAK